MTVRKCKDCPPDSKRPAPFGGPRCSTHNRAVVKARKAAARASRLEKTYGLKAGQYEAMYAAQGGVCAICQRATGASKALAVDHDHETGYVRGLLCSVDNKLLGHFRDDPEALFRAANYLLNPPAHEVIGKVKPDGPQG